VSKPKEEVKKLNTFEQKIEEKPALKKPVTQAVKKIDASPFGQ
jgi:hypothetical protein